MIQRGKVLQVASVIGLLVAFAFGATTAEAQFAPNSRRALFGGASLRSGFVPDPHVLSGRLGGPVQANQINSSCRGYISAEPSHIVRSRTGFRNLRFIVNAQSDATLMVMLPNGAILCDDDSGERMNPLVQASTPPGEIRVWVGAYSSSNVGQPYQIGFSELGHITADSLGGGMPVPRPPMPRPPMPPPPPVGGVQPNMMPAYGQVNLRAGFLPDPHVVSGNAGGPVSASSVQSSCRGHVTPQPSHVVMAQSGFRNLRVIVNSSVDLTLMVMLPNGQILCDDDGGSAMNPLLSLASPPGPIRIWVGTYSSGRSAPYNIGFSELGHIGTNNIPQPGGGGPVAVQPPPPPPPAGDVVEMQVSIPVTLIGPGMTSNTVAVWNPRGAPPVQVSLSGRDVMAGGVNLGQIPGSMRDPVVTVTQQRNGNMVVRVEQLGGDQLLLHVRYAGRPTVQDRWSGSANQRGPRWSR